MHHKTDNESFVNKYQYRTNYTMGRSCLVPKILAVCLVTIPCPVTGWYYNCFVDSTTLLNDGCSLKDIVISKNTNAEDIYFPPTNINFFVSNFSSFSPALGVRLAEETESVNFYNCQTPTLAIPVTLRRLGIFFNNLYKVFSNYRQPNQLEYLSIVGARITEVRFVEVLNQLRFLRVQSNPLRFVNFERFRNLTQLEIIDLRDNQISNIDPGSGQLELPNLKELHLSGNYLIELDGSFWNLSSLSVLRIQTNFLQTLNVQALSKTMPLLSEISLSRNPWNCKRLNDIVGYLAVRKVNYLEDGVRLGCNSFDYVEYLCFSGQDDITRSVEMLENLNESGAQYYQDAKSVELEDTIKRNEELLRHMEELRRKNGILEVASQNWS
ncbi:toll-like receptor 8 isoform X2 [Topomyia yanbarensis]|uniref:toll-like receptor 8 isoform X2 n=1 Tax=Topomyia yanbarensis TaxID=2498891 RepID=UPI00273BE526|nr:toll-like receptor 8 isoform X2 [Topomyia yanbarensis]